MMKWVPRLCALVGVLIVATGCATTTTRLAPVDPELVRTEEARQRTLAVRTLNDQQTRLDAVAWPMLVAARDLCKEQKPRFGVRWGTVHGYDRNWRSAAEEALLLGDTLAVVGVAPGSPAEEAGLRMGDRILAVGSFNAVTGKDASERLADYLEKRGDDTSPLTFEVLRGTQRLSISVNPVQACPYGVMVTQDGSINAFADGKSIYVTTAMMRFAEDDELAVIVGHELAHNAMGHIDAMRKNALGGGFLGLLADIAMASQGINTGGAYTSQFAQLGAMTFSQDFEREADYVGMYAMARTGLPLEDAPTLWRHMAIAHPGSIQLATSHPTTAERFVRLEQIIDEIEGKKARGEPLLPDMKNEQPDRR